MDKLNFENIAPYLKHPLVLSGFAIFLLFLFFRTTIKSGLIPTTSRAAGSKIINRTISYGFIIAILVIALGFILEFIKIRNNPDTQKIEQFKQKETEALIFIIAYNIQLIVDQDNCRERGDFNEINFAAAKLGIEDNNLTIKSTDQLISNKTETIDYFEKLLLNSFGLESKDLFKNSLELTERCIHFSDGSVPFAISVELEELIKPFSIPSRLKRIPVNDLFIWLQDLKEYYSETINAS